VDGEAHLEGGRSLEHRHQRAVALLRRQAKVRVDRIVVTNAVGRASIHARCSATPRGPYAASKAGRTRVTAEQLWPVIEGLQLCGVHRLHVDGLRTHLYRLYLHAATSEGGLASVEIVERDERALELDRYQASKAKLLV
jgi:hypothetical protein